MTWINVGPSVGDSVGIDEGFLVGDAVGRKVGDEVGFLLGDLLGDDVGHGVGDAVGFKVGDEGFRSWNVAFSLTRSPLFGLSVFAKQGQGYLWRIISARSFSTSSGKGLVLAVP